MDKNKRFHASNCAEKSKKIKTEPEKYVLFSKYKSELKKLVTYKEEIIKNFDDFWMFLQKFENAQKRTESTKNTLEKIKLVNAKLRISAEKLYDKLSLYDVNGDKIQLNFKCFLTFYEVLMLYIDFKQKERFLKLKKLRDTQKQLPIAEYK